MYPTQVPSQLRSKLEAVRRKALRNYNDLYEEDDSYMKFLHHKTNQIVDLSEQTYTLNISNLIDYKPLDQDARKLKDQLIIKNSKTNHDYDKIFEYNDIMSYGTWAEYYNYRPLTDIEWKRREKYYEKNRIIFNEQLDKKRAMNSNFIKMYQEEFNNAKDAITYGAPQKTVRYWMSKLYGDKVLDLLEEEDPQDAIDDPDLRNWKFI